MILRFLILLIFVLSQVGQLSAQTQKRVVGYVMNSRLAKEKPEIDVLKLTHINYAFADVVDGKVTEIHKSDKANLAYLNTLKKDNPDLKLMISVGGWTRSGGFSDAVLTKESREIFAKSAIDYMVKHDLDGIDLDWEYPGLKGNGNTFRPEDKENFTAVLDLLRLKLDVLGKEDETHYLLTIASAASQKYMDNVEMDKISKVLDFINIMTYDYFGAWSTTTGNHTNLPRSKEAVERHLKAGAPAEKLTLGVAFYGRGWKGVEGIHKPASKAAFSLNYHNIIDSLNAGDYVEMWDSMSMAPFAYNEKRRALIAYDNPRSLSTKARYVRDLGLGGIMFWEYSGDANGLLLNSIYKDLNTLPAHSHNDYEQEEPLTNALSLGLKSIEVDVHLIDDELYASHNKPYKLDPAKTLEEMYLIPLSKSDFVQDPLFLMIDVKTNAQKTYEKLAEVLAKYQSPKITYIISGNKAMESIVSDPNKLMAIDGRPSDLELSYTSEIMPLISQNFYKHFSSKYIDKIGQDEIDDFKAIVDEAHDQGRVLRLWGSPDHSEMWKFLLELGVDLVNTDNPADLKRFLDAGWK